MSYNWFKQNNNSVKINQSFVANSILYTVKSSYETKYSYNNVLIKNDVKYVIIDVKVKNMESDFSKLDLKNLSLVYGEDYVYASNYFNKYFVDLGRPYDKSSLESNKDYEYIFIFEVPISYDSNKYKIRFYTGLSDKNLMYKTISIEAKNMDKETTYLNSSLGDYMVFDKSRYGNSSLTIKNYEIRNNFISNDGSLVFKPNNLNELLLVLDYELLFDKNSYFVDLFNSNSDFFNKYLKIEYIYNGNKRIINDLSIIKSNIDNKLFVSVPYAIKDAEEINCIFNFRNLVINYKIKL